MKITEKLAALGEKEPFFSLEFFPPKTDMVRPVSAVYNVRVSQTFKPDSVEWLVSIHYL